LSRAGQIGDEPAEEFLQLVHVNSRDDASSCSCPRVWAQCAPSAPGSVRNSS